MLTLVARLSQAVLDDAAGDRHADAVWLALAVLNKRALSSARSLQHTVERRLAGLAQAGAGDPWQLGLPLVDPDGETDSADEAPDLSALSLRNSAHERALLEELADAARTAAASETKIAALVRLLRRVDEPALVFTEYRDTLQHVERRLGRPAAILHGGLTRDERSMALDAFGSGRRAVLLATDAAGEGLNLHETCRLVINLELPWNPMRLEQRIGRVDRIGQRRRVHAIHLIARGTNESRVLERLRARVARARSQLGAANPIAGDDERTIVRLIVGSDPPDDASECNCQPALPTVSLRAEADVEVERLKETRRFIAIDRCDRTPLEADCVWLSFAKRPNTRIALGRRMLLLMRAACEDGCGRAVESALVALMIAWPYCRADRRILPKDFLALVEPAATERAERALTFWREHATNLAQRFLATRIARERAIGRFVSTTPRMFQPGLFDRRAERLHIASANLASYGEADGTRRLAGLEQAGEFSIRPPQLLLILAP